MKYSYKYNFISDVNKIHAGIGDNLAEIIQWLATFIGGFMAGFIREWRLALLLLTFTPFMMIGAYFASKVSKILMLYPVKSCI